MISFKEFISRLESGEFPDNTLFSAYRDNNLIWWARVHRGSLFLCMADNVSHILSVYDKYRKTFSKVRDEVYTYSFTAVRRLYMYSPEIVTVKIHSLKVTRTKSL